MATPDYPRIMADYRAYREGGGCRDFGMWVTRYVGYYEGTGAGSGVGSEELVSGVIDHLDAVIAAHEVARVEILTKLKIAASYVEEIATRCSGKIKVDANLDLGEIRELIAKAEARS